MSGAAPTLLDAAMGTALLERGLSLAGADAISWSLSHPDDVRAVHREQVDAGAELLLADTFGARPPTGAELRAAVALARESGAKTVAVSLWPGLPTPQLAPALRSAASAGAQMIWLETAMRARDAERALLLARSESGLPVAITLALAAFPGPPPDGLAELRALLQRLAEQGAALVGLNCGPWEPAPRADGHAPAAHGCAVLSPEHALAGRLEFSGAPAPDAALARAGETPGARLDLPALVAQLVPGLPVPFALKPDAGGRTPESWAALVESCVRAGARLVGGCCGTDARHLRALRARLGAAANGTAP